VIFPLLTSSFTSFRPEDGAEQPVIGQYAKDIMAYWQLKFGNMWNNLVLYGTSGRAYTFEGLPGNVNPMKIAYAIFEQEAKELNLNEATAYFKIKPHEIAAFKRDYTKAGEVDFFQNDTMTKLEVALQARDQAGQYEFYCDTTGDIIFKPPFYNLNVIPNKPVSWIQDFEILDESISDTESQVYTHVVSHGNAFGGVDAYGLNTDITTPRTGVIDWHLLRRYGWRKWDLQVEWAGNAKKLFYHCLDALDRSNVRRISGNITIPMRPELRMGFPVWVPSHDSFYYVSGISHQYSVGGQATTTVTLIAKRSKFIAPKNIGKLQTIRTKITTTKKKNIATKKQQNRKQPKKIEEIDHGIRDANSEISYSITFPSNVGQSSSLVAEGGQQSEFGGPAILRDPKTGKLLGFPNAVMVYRTSMSGKVLSSLLAEKGDTRAKRPKKQDKKRNEGTDFTADRIQGEILRQIHNEERSKLIERIRIHRYEWGFSNAGAYDYAYDEAGEVQELNIVPASSILWGAGTDDPSEQTGILSQNEVANRSIESNANLVSKQDEIKAVEAEIRATRSELELLRIELRKFAKSNSYDVETAAAQETRQDELTERLRLLNERRIQFKAEEATITTRGSVKILPAPNVMVRPVSDEFGFEVIGHYRYGRGAFLTGGQIQIQDSAGINQTVNQLGIQFSAHGGLLTDNPRQRNLGTLSFNFAEAYEKMGPDDFTTGATFTGGNYENPQEIADINPTNQATYSSAVEKSARLGNTVFVEADALRRAVTLAELRPYTNTGSEIGEAFSNCACQLGRTNWLSVLPQEAITKILGPNQAVEENIEYTRTASPTTVVRNPDPLVAPKRSSNTARAIGVAAGANQFSASAVQEDVLTQEGQTRGVPNRAVSTDAPWPEPFSPLGTPPVPPNSVNPNSPTPVRAVDGSADSNISIPSITSAGQDYASNPQNRSGQNKAVIKGTNFSTENFFNILNQYLTDKFSREYQENASREGIYTARSSNINPSSPHGKEHLNSLLSPANIEGPGGSLFDRAASGDPDALAKIRAGANFNFGQTKLASEKFNAAFKEGGEIDFHLSEAGRKVEETGQVLNDEWPNLAIGPGTIQTVDTAKTVGQVLVPKYRNRQPQPREYQETPIIRPELIASLSAPEDPPITTFGGPPRPNLPKASGQPSEITSPPEEPTLIITNLEDNEVSDEIGVPDDNGQYPQNSLEPEPED